MIDRDEIRAEIGRRHLSISAVSRNTGISGISIRTFLNGGDARLSTVSAIVSAVGGKLAILFDQNDKSTFEAPNAEPA